VIVGTENVLKSPLAIPQKTRSPDLEGLIRQRIERVIPQRVRRGKRKLKDRGNTFIFEEGRGPKS